MDSGAGAGAAAEEVPASISELCENHQLALKNLTLTTQPLKTLHFFSFATFLYIKRSFLIVFTRGGLVLLMIFLGSVIGGVSLILLGIYEKQVELFLSYTRYVLWWVALGVASSIGLGSGLHTFVLYLGPHIALFTLTALKCGRVDLKSAPYDTIQLSRGPSWLEKDCREFGNPLHSYATGSNVPISAILSQVQLEAILWGLGTALGELPPYFIARAARLSGSKVEVLENLDADSIKEDGFFSAFLKKINRLFLSHSQHLNFFTILLLASVPNPFFDFAGIICGQLGIPFWKFFLSTLIGKAIIKTHIQTLFVISVCNNQLIEWVENEFNWVLGQVPGFSSALSNVSSKLHIVKEKYISSPIPSAAIPVDKGKPWDLSFTFMWNTVIWLVLVNFFVKIVTAVAQNYLKQQQDLEMELLLGKMQSNGALQNPSTSKDD